MLKSKYIFFKLSLKYCFCKGDSVTLCFLCSQGKGSHSWHNHCCWN